MDKKRKRAIFFWILVFLFILIAPSVVLYANGFRFDLRRGIFVHSGTIAIKSNPQNINTILDGKINSSLTLDKINNSYNLTGLMPGNYNLSVTANDYQTWNKKIEVHSGIASEFWNVLLVKNNYNRTDYDVNGINKFFISPKDAYAAYTQNDENNNLNVRILNTKTKESTLLFTFPGWNFIAEIRKENIEWSPNEDYLSVPVEKTVSDISNRGAKTNPTTFPVITYNYFILNPAQNTSFNLNELLKNNDINYVRWDPKDKNYLFYLSNNSLYRTNISNVSDTTQIAQDVSSFDLSKTNIYYSQMPNEIVYKTNLDGSGNPIQITSNFPNDISRNFRLIAYDDIRIAFLTQAEDLYIFNVGGSNTYFKKLESDIKGLQFSDDGKKLLYWTNNAISVYYLQNWAVQPIRTEDSIEDITRYSDTIKNVQWSKDYEHIIFSVNSTIKIIELDPRDYRNCMDILRTKTPMPELVDNHAQNKLFFIDTKNNDSSGFYSISFPEPTPILGIYTPTAD